MAYADSDGDYIEGTVQWWWKYVLPNREQMWLAVLTSREPDPHPWLRKATGEVLEGLVMLHAAARADQAAGNRLRSEAVERIHEAVARIPRAELEQR